MRTESIYIITNLLRIFYERYIPVSKILAPTSAFSLSLVLNRHQFAEWLYWTKGRNVNEKSPFFDGGERRHFFLACCFLSQREKEECLVPRFLQCSCRTLYWLYDNSIVFFSEEYLWKNNLAYTSFLTFRAWFFKRYLFWVTCVVSYITAHY